MIDVESALEQAAGTARPFPIPADRLIAEGRRRRARRRAVLASALAAVVVAGAATAAVGGVIQGRDDELVATAPPVPSAAAPTEAALVDALAEALPEYRLLATRQLPADPMLEGNDSLYSGHRRIGGLEANAASTQNRALSVNWQVVSPGLADGEIPRIVEAQTRTDPAAPAVAEPAELIFADGGRIKTQVLQTAVSSLLAVSWADNGTVVVARLSGLPEGTVPNGDADRLFALAHALAGIPLDGTAAVDPATSPAPAGPAAAAAPTVQSLEGFGRTADTMPIVGDPQSRTNAEAAGRRILDCVSVSRAVEIGGRDWTKDTGPNGTGVVRALYLYSDPDMPGLLHASTVLFDWVTRQVVSTDSQRSARGGPKVDPASEQAGRVPCPDGSGPA